MSSFCQQDYSIFPAARVQSHQLMMAGYVYIFYNSSTFGFNNFKYYVLQILNSSVLFFYVFFCFLTKHVFLIS